MHKQCIYWCFAYKKTYTLKGVCQDELFNNCKCPAAPHHALSALISSVLSSYLPTHLSGFSLCPPPPSPSRCLVLSEGSSCQVEVPATWTAKRKPSQYLVCMYVREYQGKPAASVLGNMPEWRGRGRIWPPDLQAASSDRVLSLIPPLFYLF